MRQSASLVWTDKRARRRRVRSLAALRAQRALYLAMIETARAPVLAVSPEGRVLHWSAAAERLYGYAAEEMLG